MQPFHKLTTIFLLLSVFLVSTSSNIHFDGDEAKDKQAYWVDSVFNALNEDQKLGQLFMIAAYSNVDEAQNQVIENIIKDYQIGGLIFMQGGPVRQATLTNRYQAASKTPLLISMDAEWGLSMRLDSTLNFPKQMTLGAIQEDKYVYEMGKEIAMQCKRLGVHVSFSPDIDINSNPLNPIIGVRSFGENKENVARKGIAYMKGLQHHGVMAVAKHFPGHGDTDRDSHLGLPTIKHSKKRMDEIELYPFKKLIRDSVGGVLVAHLNIPAYDNTPNRASTLSKNIVTDLLKEKLDFQGLIFTDALNMKGVSKFFKPGEVDVMALKAGNDVLLFSEDVPIAINKIKEALANGDLDKKEVYQSVKKILNAKYWAGLNKYKPIEIKNLYQDLHSAHAKALRHTLFEKAVTVVSNANDLIPFKFNDTTKFASIAFGTSVENEFQKTLTKYAHFENHHFLEHHHFTSDQIEAFVEKYAHKTVIISIHGMNNSPAKDYGITKEISLLVQKLEQKTKVVVVLFGNPYALKYFENSPHVVCAYEHNEITKKLVPQVLFGALKANGKLPVSATSTIREGRGFFTLNTQKLQYGIPEQVGMLEEKLHTIDTIVTKAIKNHVMPGCEIVVARKGKVIYEKSFGKQTYLDSLPVQDSTIYDIASISKVAGTLQAVMFLYEQGEINLDSTISTYLPELKGTNKANIFIREVLTHQAGLQPFIEHNKKTMENGNLKDTYYCNKKDSIYNLSITPTIFAIPALPDSMWHWTIQSSLISKNHNAHNSDTSCYPYRYSDISFYIMKRIVETKTNQVMNEFLDQHFYAPLGMYNTTYKPLEKFNIERIPPTEDEPSFRKQIIRGTVHDPGAAMMGGVAGHAGLFSTANDLAILMQTHLQKGTYGGVNYFKPETVNEFSRAQYTSCRRGLGWDKPQLGGSSPTSDLCSFETFGHTGFTGTCAWVDPKYDLVFIFLSNRTFPNAENKKLITQNIRTKIQDVIYQSIVNITPEEL